ncbi:MAG: universal stress protein [Pseudomonadota bacterium]
MADYKHILLAVDLHENFDDDVVTQAVKLAKEHAAKITIVHVLEHLTAYGIAQAYPGAFEIEESIRNEATETIQSLIDKHAIKDVDVIIEPGSPKMLIIDKAKELNADLIVLGSHGRHGLSLLLGSTANAVLHHAPCDVLAVRVKEK